MTIPTLSAAHRSAVVLTHQRLRLRGPPIVVMVASRRHKATGMLQRWDSATYQQVEGVRSDG